MLHRKRLTALGAGLLAIAILYSAAWFGVSLLMLRAAEHWIETQRQHGAVITYGEPTFSGFPMRPVIAFPDVSAALPKAEGGWAWNTARIRLSVSWSLNDLTFDMSGAHAFTGPWPQGIATLNITAPTATARLHINDTGDLDATHVNSEGVSIAWTGQEPLLKMDRLSLDVAMTDSPQLVSKIIFETDNVMLPDVVPTPMSRTIRRIRLTTEIQGPLNKGPLPRVLESWRTAGGDLEIRDIYLDWEPLTASGTGTAALDDALQPMGAFTFKFTGFFAAVDALKTQGLVTPSNASLAKIVLGFLAKAPAGGGAPELSLALTIQDRKLMAGPAPLMEMPEISWPANVVMP